MKNVTPEQKLNAVLNIIAAVAEAIQALKEVPSGHLYAHLMGQMSLDTYQEIIVILKGRKLVHEEPSHLLKWIGPAAGQLAARPDGSQPCRRFPGTGTCPRVPGCQDNPAEPLLGGCPRLQAANFYEPAGNGNRCAPAGIHPDGAAGNNL
jgi:hypothetical protein